jgi:outer membrane protein assembly factor BamB
VVRIDASATHTQFRNGAGLNDVERDPVLPARFAWRFNDPKKGTSASPVVAGSVVLIAANDHTLYAIDVATGALAWRWHGDNEIMTSPVVRGSTAIVGTGTGDSIVFDPPVYQLVGEGKSDLDAIDLRTGKPLWSFALTGSGMPTPAIVGDTLLHIDGSGVFLALDASSGAYKWRQLFYSNGSMTNVLAGNDGLVYFDGGDPNVVYALRDRDGRQVWAHGFSSRDGAFDDCPLATDGTRLFGMYAQPLDRNPKVHITLGVAGREHVFALDARTGRLRWDTALAVTGTEPSYNESAIPMYANGILYEGSPFAPQVTALDARTGRPLWSLHVNGAVKGGLVERDGVLYFGDLGGTLWAVEARTGRTLGSLGTDLKFNVGSPIILNDSLIIGSQKGPVIAVPLDAIRASQPVPGVTT